MKIVMPIEQKIMVTADEAAALLSRSRSYFDESIRFDKRFKKLGVEVENGRYSQELLKAYGRGEGR
ncbi:hypothetical protein WOSG25_041450 [Weissella oryzae SG25]|uniref:Uncharacterized protein n=1 Tax=Weissella oryzae (strain DSM 25784 / JCM 18191 / LMG 30913 / SG25) TaxID=1329250 RepID=A0A069CTB7_WEIOS|nr:hypothetical protein [Weissella oryzae]GAK30704.1 hypothetical protein WOSG25_041450 [Weissella oryzae SG25]